MKLAFVTALILASSSMVNAQALKIPPERQKEFQQAAVRLVFADGCNKRLDRPELVIDARAAFLKFLIELNTPNAEVFVDKAVQTLANQPVEKETSKLSLFNEKMCGDVAVALKAYLAK